MERLPLGDGSFGAMCQGATPFARFTLNHDTSWSGSWPRVPGGPDADTSRSVLAEARERLRAGQPAQAERALARLQSGHSQAYLPTADLEIRRDGPTSALPARTLDLVEAVHEVTDCGVQETSFVSDGVFVHRVRGATVTGVHITSPLWATKTKRVGGEMYILVRMPRDVAPGHEPASAPVDWGDGSDNVVEAAILARVLEPGADGQVVLATIVSTFDRIGAAPKGTAEEALARARALLDAVEERGADDLERVHRAGHRTVMERVRLAITAPAAQSGSLATMPTDERLRRAAEGGNPLMTDPGLVELLFHYGRYLLWASSRPGSLPPTLQGLWNQRMQPPWSSNYTVNINAQMNYWGAQVANLPEAAEPLGDMVRALAEHGTETARRLYDAPGWVCHHNTDAWAFTEIAGAQQGDACWAFWPMAGPWLVHQLWEAVEFGTASTEQVASWWPAIRGATEFGLFWLRRDTDGNWDTSPATSPENTYRGPNGETVGVDSTSALDLQLLRRLFSITVAAAERLDIASDPVVAEASSRAAELPRTPPIGTDGLPIEWAQERETVDPHHRHVSPLFWLYPGDGSGEPSDRRAAAALLQRRGDDSAGWSVMWKSALWARLHRPDKVSDVLRYFIRPSHEMDGPFGGGLYPDLLASHPPFQIDGNLGFVAAFSESLLQSHDGIELLPALPPELRDGECNGLIARPGVRVSLLWRDGRLVRAALRPLGGRIVVRLRWDGRERMISLAPDRDTTVTPTDFER